MTNEASERVESIKQRRAKITTPPWVWEPVGEFDGEPSNAGGFVYQHIRAGYKGVADTYHASGQQYPDGSVSPPRDGNKNDADFIAAAPTDIDFLLAAVARQEADIGRLVETHAAFQRRALDDTEYAATAMKTAILEKVREMGLPKRGFNYWSTNAESYGQSIDALERGYQIATGEIIDEIEKTKIS